MTRKNAKKLAARARQEKYGGSYAGHWRHLEVEGGDSEPDNPLGLFLPRTVSELRDSVQPLVTSADGTCAMSITAGRPAPVSGLVLHRWELDGGAVKTHGWSALNGVHAQTLRHGLDYLVGRRSFVSSIGQTTGAISSVRTLEELRESLLPNDFLMHPGGRDRCWVLRRWEDGIELARWTVRGDDVSRAEVARLRRGDAEALRDEVLKLLPVPSPRVTSEPARVQRLRQCVMAAHGYVRFVFENSDLHGLVLALKGGNSGPSTAPVEYGDTALLRLDDGRAWLVDMLDVLHVESASPPARRGR